MATFDWTTLTFATALSTELNGLTDGTFSSSSGAIDNTVQPRNQIIALELNLASLSPATGAFVDVWIEYAADGTNFSDHGKALQTAGLLATFQLDTAATTAQRLPVQFKPVLGLKFKLSARCKAGVALNASGNTLKYALTTDESF